MFVFNRKGSKIADRVFTILIDVVIISILFFILYESYL